MIDPRNNTKASRASSGYRDPCDIPRLTNDQETFLARVRNTRKQGYMLSMEEADILIQIVEELTK